MKDATLIISGGTVISEDKILANHDVFVRNGKIAAVRPSGMHGCEEDSFQIGETFDEDAPTLPNVIDARGAFIAPGLIDVHSDFIETIASPRPSVIMDMKSSLYQADRLLAAHGITTMYHSLSLYGEKIFDHKPIRNFENVQKLITAVNEMRETEGEDHLIRHRLHLRVEIDAVIHFERIKELIESSAIDMISFMDHTPGQGQYADLDVFSNTLKGYRDLTDEEISLIIKSQQVAQKLSIAQMAELARLAKANGISIASHDDDTVDKVECMASLGAAISEFPITLDVAKHARSQGMHTLAGAPNVMMGHSHSGNLSAREAIEADAIDVLCSDYYPSAMVGAVFLLHEKCGLDLAKALALVTKNPAEAAGISSNYGSLAVGKSADLIIVRELPLGENSIQTPIITGVFVGGKPVIRTTYDALEKKRNKCAGAGDNRVALSTPTSPSNVSPQPSLAAEKQRAALSPLLQVKNLSKSFTLHAVGREINGCTDIDLCINAGEFVGITGKSGSGKSTILRCIYRTNLPELGEIIYDSAAFGQLDLACASQRQINYLRKYEIGYVSQFLNVLPRRSAYDIVLQSAIETYGIDMLDKCHAETKAMLNHFDISEDLWSVFPRTFSGGEKLRLNIAAAMIKKPRLLLLDEPTASLDNASKIKVRELIEELKNQGTTMLGIFHDLEFMEGLCDKEFNMQEGMMVV